MPKVIPLASGGTRVHLGQCERRAQLSNLALCWRKASETKRLSPQCTGSFQLWTPLTTASTAVRNVAIQCGEYWPGHTLVWRENPFRESDTLVCGPVCPGREDEPMTGLGDLEGWVNWVTGLFLAGDGGGSLPRHLAATETQFCWGPRAVEKPTPPQHPCVY